MDENELRAKLNYSRGAALAAGLCLQQIVRVLLDRNVIAKIDLQDVDFIA